MFRLASVLSLIVIATGCVLARTGRSPARGIDDCAFRVCIRAVAGTESVVYLANNQAAIPATVGIYFQRLENLMSSDPDTVVRVIPPGQRWVLVRLWVTDPDQQVRAQPVVTIDLGSDSLEHRPSQPYALPFGGEAPRPLLSGYGGPTHLEQNHYSLDFGMPEGTPILAARDGVVVYTQDGFTRGGLIPDLIERANLVAVGHDDGTVASYGHLRRGIPVAVGDTVRTGQVLGWSGSTGFSGRPHLHFHVGKRLVGGEQHTIPVEFLVGEDGPMELTEGGLYGPAVELTGP